MDSETKTEANDERVVAAAIKILDVAVRAAFPFLLGVAGWTFTSIKDLDSRVHFIEQTRYTQADRDKDFAVVTDKLQAVLVSQAVQQSQLETILKKLDGSKQ